MNIVHTVTNNLNRKQRLLAKTLLMHYIIRRIVNLNENVIIWS